MMRRAFAFLVLGWMVLTAQANSSLLIESAWARPNPAVVPNSAAYLKMTNTGTVADRLLEVSGDVAARVELHETRLESGMMTMRPMTEGIAIAPGATLVLAPHGLHVMLIGLRAPLEVGQTFPLTLRFEQAGEVTVTVTVRESAP